MTGIGSTLVIRTIRTKSMGARPCGIIALGLFVLHALYIIDVVVAKGLERLSGRA